MWTIQKRFIGKGNRTRFSYYTDSVWVSDLSEATLFSSLAEAEAEAARCNDTQILNPGEKPYRVIFVHFNFLNAVSNCRPEGA